MAHKLVKVVDGHIMTGDELKIVLMLEGFTVPIIEPVNTEGKPQRPTVTQSMKGLTVEQIWANTEIWKQYGRDLMEWNTLYQADLKRWDDEVKAFAGVLSEWFTLVRGTYNRTTKQYDYSTTTPLAYSYWQCAMKLTGAKKPLNGIDFICYLYF